VERDSREGFREAVNRAEGSEIAGVMVDPGVGLFTRTSYSMAPYRV
jgi:hypothetical protein